jgi:hypothetical protein
MPDPSALSSAPIWGLFGGIGGAALTFLLGRIVERRSQKRLLFKSEVQPFSLPRAFTTKGANHALHVSWSGKNYESLERSTFTLANRGRTAIDPFDLVVQVPLETEVLETVLMVSPIIRDIESSKESKADCYQITFKIPELEPADSAEISMLYNGLAPLFASPRKASGVKIVNSSLEDHTEKMDARNRMMGDMGVVIIAVLGLLISIVQVTKVNFKDKDATHEANITSFLALSVTLGALYLAKSKPNL